ANSSGDVAVGHGIASTCPAIWLGCCVASKHVTARTPDRPARRLAAKSAYRLPKGVAAPTPVIQTACRWLTVNSPLQPRYFHQCPARRPSPRHAARRVQGSTRRVPAPAVRHLRVARRPRLPLLRGPPAQSSSAPTSINRESALGWL